MLPVRDDESRPAALEPQPLRVQLTVPAQYIASVAVGRTVTLDVDAYTFVYRPGAVPGYETDMPAYKDVLSDADGAVQAVFTKGEFSAAYSGFEGTDADGTTLTDWLARRKVDTPVATAPGYTHPHGLFLGKSRQHPPHFCAFR